MHSWGPALQGVFPKNNKTLLNSLVASCAQKSKRTLLCAKRALVYVKRAVQCKNSPTMCKQSQKRALVYVKRALVYVKRAVQCKNSPTMCKESHRRRSDLAELAFALNFESSVDDHLTFISCWFPCVYCTINHAIQPPRLLQGRGSAVPFASPCSCVLPSTFALHCTLSCLSSHTLPSTFPFFSTFAFLCTFFIFL